MVRASSLASLTGSPFTAVITSPDSMPALAAGPLACGSAEAERIADREHPIADPELALRKLGERTVRTALDLDQRDVGARVGADHLRGKGLAVVGRDFDLVGAIRHVVVGHSIAIGRDE